MNSCFKQLDLNITKYNPMFMQFLGGKCKDMSFLPVIFTFPRNRFFTSCKHCTADDNQPLPFFFKILISVEHISSVYKATTSNRLVFPGLRIEQNRSKMFSYIILTYTGFLNASQVQGSHEAASFSTELHKNNKLDFVIQTHHPTQPRHLIAWIAWKLLAIY